MGAAVKEPETDNAGPTFFSGSGYLVDEIELGIRVLSSKVKNLKEGNQHRAAVTQKLAAEEIAKVAGQVKAMADSLSRVTITHLNRRGVRP